MLRNRPHNVLMWSSSKSVCGISIVRDYYEHLKFNVMEIAKVRNETEGFKDGEGRVVKNSIAEQEDTVPA